MNYIVTQPMKSKGVATLLVLFFGGFGVFYSSILGGFIMGIIAPVSFFLFFFTGLISEWAGILFIIFLFLYFLISLIWALNAVDSYNNKLLSNAIRYNKYINGQQASQPNTLVTNNANAKNQLFQDLIEAKKLLDSNIISKEEYNKLKEQKLSEINSLEQGENLASATQPFDQNSKNATNRKIMWIWILIALVIILLLFRLYNSKTDSVKIDKDSGSMVEGTKKANSKKNKIDETISSQSIQSKNSETLFEIDKKVFVDVDYENPNYEFITDMDKINSLLTNKLKEQLNINSRPLLDDYRFYDIGTVKYNNFNLIFFIYQYNGLGVQSFAQINVCNQSGRILDTKQIGEDTYDEEADNSYTFTTSLINGNGEILLKTESQNGTNSKMKRTTTKYYINPTGKIIKL